jgi:hypothetical protein
MKKIIYFSFLLFTLSILAHTVNYKDQVLHHWYIQKENKYIDGSFHKFKNGMVSIEDEHNLIIDVPLNYLSKADQSYVNEKKDAIINLNSINSEPKIKKNTFLSNKGVLFILLIVFIGMIIYILFEKKYLKYIFVLFFGSCILTLFSFGKKLLTLTDPTTVNEAFAPFVPNVHTSWDTNYFYVESKGIPNHTMMVGISNHGWQQQVPIPQCYIGTNHWSIPLNPVVATAPIPIDNVHFTRGAIALAANGVPIFNYHTNTGVDSYLDGQLDIYGGHCGRGDDYHYHIAPLHLYSLGQTTSNLPCAYSFDGYPVYGNVEPDGSPMVALDTNHGHFGTNGVYHYHGTATAPYMIANFVGQVTEDATYQLIPQPAAHPVRNENWTPLAGSLITSCVANANNNGYNLSYTLNGTPGYATNFSWSGTTYTFNYVTPTGTTTTPYNGFTQCSVPLAATIFTLDSEIMVYPNPASEILNIKISDSNLENEIQTISIYDVKGSLISKNSKFVSTLDIKKLSTGTYFVKIQFLESSVTKKIVIK